MDPKYSTIKGLHCICYVVRQPVFRVSDIQAGLSKIQGLLKDFPTVFQVLKFMKNANLC